MDFDDDEAFMESGEEDETPNHSGDEDDGIAMEPAPTMNSDGKEDDFEYTVLTPDEIVQEMCTMIKDVAAVVQIQPTTCRILLHHYKWNKESLLERFYDAADPEKFFREAHVVSPFVRQAKPREHLSGPRVVHCPTEETCLICFLMLPTSSLTGLECGHRFCTLCWGLYLTTKVMEEGRGQSIACPEHKCDILVDDAKAMEL
uniref:RBR-type E3 ubiquitin transferase n=1 Tax=Plectus sambesii TaxID=2011161 RepID=A0A914VPU0_9BILA